jgi:hypothetical protein
VALARQLAAQGFWSLRLDLSGIGDSPASGHMGTFMESAVADVAEVMTAMQARGAERFVLFGLCSGADNGIAAALVDSRVCGLVLLDPHSYPTPRSRLRKILRRAERDGRRATARWLAELALRQARARVTARLAQLRAEGGAASEPDSGGRRPPPFPKFRADLLQIVDRGVRVLAIYTGALGDRYNHPDQLFELIPALRGRVDRQYFPTANHMFTERVAQAALIDTVAPWIASRFA